MNPENNPCIQTVSGLPPKFNHLFIGPLPICPRKFHANPFGSFCTKLLANKVGWLEFNVPFQHKYVYIRDDANKQTDKQTLKQAGWFL